MTDEAALNRLAEYHGIDPGYWDIWGQYHHTSSETKQRFLAAMGVAAQDDDAIHTSLRECEMQAWRRALPVVQVVREAELPLAITLILPIHKAKQGVVWRLREEGGRPHQGSLPFQELQLQGERDVEGVLHGRYVAALDITPPCGYHRLEWVPQDQLPVSMALIVAPRTCYLPVALEAGARVWGLAAQLYSLRSQQNWGMGDFSDLRQLVRRAAQSGASLVGINPLHALFPNDPRKVSPYAPSSRLFLNILYLDVQAIADFKECTAAQRRVRAPAFQDRLQSLREAELVDYPTVATAKLEILEMLYDSFVRNHAHRESGRAREFLQFKETAGPALHWHALYECLQQHFQKKDPGIWGWPAWPQAYRHPDSPKVEKFSQRHIARVEFYQYLQWQTELQLGEIKRACSDNHMAVGLYQDLALSVDRGGAEVWSNQDLYALDVSLGCPPDDFNLLGQDWGLPPLIPSKLKESAYAPFIAMLRENMHFAGALRIDHVMSLMRLFWIPAGGKSADGAYVQYPLQDLLGILALESQRNQCLVIGEDLGTVPDAIRNALGPLKVLSYRLLYFEKSWDGHFKKPHDYARQALVTVSTHDLPTLKGFWEYLDFEVRDRLGLFPSDQWKQDHLKGRDWERYALLTDLQGEGLLPEGLSTDPSAVTMTRELSKAVHVYAAKSPAMIMTVQLEDVLGIPDQANVPGTVDEYPNWKRKLNMDVEALFRDGNYIALSEALCEARGSAP